MAPQSGGNRSSVVLLLLLLNMTVTSVAWLWISTGPQVVHVCPEDKALLRCLFNVEDSPPPINLDALVVQWILRGKEVVVTFEGVTTIWRSRAELCIEELKKGNASLTITAVEPDDYGEYTCVIFYHTEFNKIEVTLKYGHPNPWDCE